MMSPLIKTSVFIFFIATSQLSLSQQTTYNVDVVYPELRSEVRQLSLSGTVDAKQRARLAPLEAGVVSELNVEIGDEILKGQPLLQLDTQLALLTLDSIKAEMLVAEVQLKEAKRLYQEATDLKEQQVIAATLIAQRSSEVASAQAQLSRAIANLNLHETMVKRHQLNAPFKGVIVQRNVEVGEWVTQQTPVFTLVSQENLRVNIDIPQEYLPYLSKHNFVKVDITPDTPNLPSVQANLSRLVPVSNNMSRTFTAQIDLPPNPNYVAGMSVTALLDLPQTSTNEIVLPRSAIKQHPDGGSSVFVVENNKAKRINTPFKRINAEQVAIPDPATPFPFIVTAVELLVDNAPVNVNHVRGQ